MNRLRRYAPDLLIALAAAAGAAEVATGGDRFHEAGTALWVAAPAVAVVLLTLLARRRFPFGAPVALWVLATALSFLDGRMIVSVFAVYVGGITAAFLLGNLPDDRLPRFGLAIVVCATEVLVYNDPNRAPGDFLFVPAMFVIAWLAGFALRARAVQAQAAEHRAAQAERDREAAARLAVAEERARIARELHDIVAHAVSVMVLQVGAVRHKLPAAQAEDKEALQAAEQAGRAALTEMRRLLGAMHDDRTAELAPQPGLDELGALVEKVRRAGLPARVHIEGTPVRLPRAVDLSAYRIVQEGLTNSLKHAAAAHADVTVRYGADSVLVEVRDDGVGVTPGDGLGHGLVGIRERVKIYGGEMAAGAVDEGGFLLQARLLLDGHRS